MHFRYTLAVNEEPGAVSNCGRQLDVASENRA